MRTLLKAPTAIASLSLALALAAGLLSRADAPDRQDDDAKASASVNREQARLSEEIKGAWILMSAETANEYVDSTKILGFATFVDGYHTMLFGGNEPSGLIFGPRVRVAMSSSASRYRISPRYTLQVASIMSFSNMTEDGRFRYFPSGETIEYEIRVEDGLLELTSQDGRKRTFRRLDESEFPLSAIDKIQENSGGWEFAEDATGRR